MADSPTTAPTAAEPASTSPPPDVSVVVVSWNTRDLLLGCLASLPDAVGDLRADIWVVDNHSTDGSVEAVRARYPGARVIANDRNAGYAAAGNLGIAASDGRYVLLLNADTLVCRGAIERLVRFADACPAAGIVGPLLLDPDGSFQASFADFPTLASECLSASGLGRRLFHRNYPTYGPRRSRAARPADVVAGACALVRRTALLEVGPLDEGYGMYSEEIDWCWRMWQAGWQVWYVPGARVVHFGGRSTSQRPVAMARALYRAKVRFFRKRYGHLSATILRAMLVGIRRARWLVRHLAPRGRPDPRPEPPIRWRDLGG